MSRCRRVPFALWAMLVSLFAAPLPARAESSSHKFNAFVSGTGNIAYLSAGVLLPMVEDGAAGTEHTKRVLDALSVSVAASEGLKLITREKRPDATSRDSFPSGHATAAFAVATVESYQHPKQAALWYGGATLIAASRVSLHRHYVHDVLAGAALGYLVGRHSARHPYVFRLTADIGASTPAYGLSFHKAF